MTVINKESKNRGLEDNTNHGGFISGAKLVGVMLINIILYYVIKIV